MEGLWSARSLSTLRKRVRFTAYLSNRERSIRSKMDTNTAEWVESSIMPLSLTHSSFTPLFRDVTIVQVLICLDYHLSQIELVLLQLLSASTASREANRQHVEAGEEKRLCQHVHLQWEVSLMHHRFVDSFQQHQSLGRLSEKSRISRTCNKQNGYTR